MLSCKGLIQIIHRLNDDVYIRFNFDKEKGFYNRNKDWVKET